MFFYLLKAIMLINRVGLTIQCKLKCIGTKIVEISHQTV
jgi:hypothetical protein